MTSEKLRSDLNQLQTDFYAVQGDYMELQRKIEIVTQVSVSHLRLTFTVLFTVSVQPERGTALGMCGGSYGPLQSVYCLILPSAVFGVPLTCVCCSLFL